MTTAAAAPDTSARSIADVVRLVELALAAAACAGSAALDALLDDLARIASASAASAPASAGAVLDAFAEERAREERLRSELRRLGPPQYRSRHAGAADRTVADQLQTLITFGHVLVARGELEALVTEARRRVLTATPAVTPALVDASMARMAPVRATILDVCREGPPR